MPVNAAWRNRNAGVRLSDVRRIGRRLDAVIRDTRDTRPNGEVDGFELASALRSNRVSRQMFSAAFTVRDGAVVANSDGGPAPWSPPTFAQMRDFLGASLRRLARSDKNHDGRLDANELRDVNSTTRQVLVELAKK